MISSFMGFKLPKKSLRSTGTCSKCLTPATGARIKMPSISAPGRSDSEMCYPLSNSCHLHVKNIKMKSLLTKDSCVRKDVTLQM